MNLSARLGSGVLLAALIAGCATGSGAAEREDPNCAWRVCLRFSDTPTGRSYRIVNREPVPVTVSLTFITLTNLRPQSALPVDTVVQPGATATVATLISVAQDRTIGAEPALSVDLGSSDTTPDPDAVYSVPFAGADPREVVQGYGGTDSHMGGMRFSIDFAMPPGTPVVASRAGTVLYLQDGFVDGGPDPELLERANLVVVAHQDGTMASYGHLSPGILVEVGDSVDRGQRLGFSGSTGFAGRPHLHFHVGTRLLGDPGRTVRVRLLDDAGNPVEVSKGSLVAPARPPTEVPR